jgi:hypothetical protein
MLDLGVIEERTPVDIGLKPKIFDFIVGRELYTVMAGSKVQHHVRSCPPDCLAGREPECRQSSESGRDQDVHRTGVSGGSKQFRGGGNFTFEGIHRALRPAGWVG